MLGGGPPLSPKSPQHATSDRAQVIKASEFSHIFANWSERIREVMAAREVGGADGAPWALVGIKRRGAILARRLRTVLSQQDSGLRYGEIDISLYRDDYHLQTEKPMVLGTEISFRIDGVKILLVDDVLFTGRTVRAAMDLLLDFGRPRLISLAVFVDRGHRELPIAANFIGRTLATERTDKVLVNLSEMGEEDSVEVERRPAATGIELDTKRRR